jgi:hypothetical protein
MQFCKEFRAFFAFESQLLIESIPKLPFFVFGKLGQRRRPVAATRSRTQAEAERRVTTPPKWLS